MNRLYRSSVKARVLSSRLGSLLLLFQRSPVVQMLFPEARVLGGAGIGELAKWTVATVAGLGAYDTVAGATTVSQLTPNGTAGSTSVTAAVGSPLSFVVQCTGAPGTPGSWTMTSTQGAGLPALAGLTHSNSKSSTTDSLTGTPATAGTYTVTAKAWENTNFTGGSSSKAFTLTVGPAVITTAPASTSITSGTSTTLTVVGSGTPLAYQWYRGASGVTTSPISGAISSSYTTPILTASTNYWVKVTRGTLTATTNPVAANSATATISIGIAPAITTHPAPSTTINSGETTTLTVAASGTPTPTYQWYVGSPPNISTPASGASASTASYTPPALSTSMTYWAKATNSSGSANTNAAVVTVNQPATITTHPVPVSIYSGTATTLSVVAAGTGPFTYQWYQGKSGVTTAPVGSNAPSYNTAALSADATYWVKVSNAANSSGANSNSATVTVLNETFSNWQTSQFNALQLASASFSGPTADPDGDGITNEKEYIFGLSPLAASPSPAPSFLTTSGQSTLSFTAKAATGSGYMGRTRHYAIDASDALNSGSWTTVPGYQDIVATGQNVTYITPMTGSRKFYHLRVWLTP